MKTLDALRLRPLTSEPYCPCAADEDGVFESVARFGGAGPLGAGGDKLLETKKGRSPLREVRRTRPDTLGDRDGGTITGE
jgi:hypothetical protein